MKKKLFCVICAALFVLLLMPFSIASAKTPVAPRRSEMCLPGDIDGDMRITSADARLALRFAAHLQEPDDKQWIGSDLNEDGITSSAEARQILRASAKLGTLECEIYRNVRHSYVLGPMYDIGSFRWSYVNTDESALTVVKSIEPLPDDAEPGDAARQRYEVIPTKTGTFTLKFTYSDTGSGISNYEINYKFVVSETAKDTDDPLESLARFDSLWMDCGEEMGITLFCGDDSLWSCVSADDSVIAVTEEQTKLGDGTTRQNFSLRAGAGKTTVTFALKNPAGDALREYVFAIPVGMGALNGDEAPEAVVPG